MKALYVPIVDQLGNRVAATCGGAGAAYEISYNPTCRKTIPKEELERLRLNHPDVYNEYVQESEFRTFRVKRKIA